MNHKPINPACMCCKSYNDAAKQALVCYSKKCPSTNKKLIIDGFGNKPIRKPNWDPNN